MAQEVGTAKFTVDVNTGKVTVTPLGGIPSGAKAILSGAAVTFSTGDITVDPNELTRHVLNVSLTNNRNEAISGPFRLLFGPFVSLTNPNLDQRANTTVATVAGSGGAGYVDGFGTGAQVKQPLGMCSDVSGDVYFGTAEGKIRRVRNGTVSTIASGFGKPAGLCFSSTMGGAITYGVLLVADAATNKIYQVNVQSGAVSLVLGLGTNSSVDGDPTKATFSSPTGIATFSGTVANGQNGSVWFPTIFVTDFGTGKIRQLSAGFDSSGNPWYVATTIASGLNKPTALVLDSSGNSAIAESGANRIQLNYGTSNAATLGTGSVGASDGTGATASFSAPQGLAFGANAGTLFVADSGNNRIRQITLSPDGTGNTPANWTVATLAGAGSAGSQDGAGNLATLNGPATLVATPGGVEVGDTANNRIRMVTANGGLPITVGKGGGTVPVDPVRLSNPTGFSPGANAQPYILTDCYLPTGQSQQLGQWSLIVPAGVNYFSFTVTVEATTDTESPPNAVLNPGPTPGPGSSATFVRTLAGGVLPSFVNGSYAECGFGTVNSIGVQNQGLGSFTTGGGTGGGTAGTGSTGVTTGAGVPSQGQLWVADAANNAIRRVGYALDQGSNGGQLLPDQVTTIGNPSGVAGTADGPAGTSKFNAPAGIAVSSDGVVFIADTGNNTVRVIYTPANVVSGDPSSPAYYAVTTIAGTPGAAGFADGPGNTAKFNKPVSIAMNSAGDLFVTESGGNRVRRITRNGLDPTLAANWIVSTVAGDTTTVSPVGAFADGVGSAARFNDPRAITIANTGDMYVADRANNRIRRIQVGGNVTTLAGSATAGYADSDTGSAAKFSGPTGVGVTPSGYIYVVDAGNREIRRVSQAGTVRTVAGNGIPGVVDGAGNVAQFGSNLNGVLALPTGDLLVGDGSRLRVVERIINTAG